MEELIINHDVIKTKLNKFNDYLTKYGELVTEIKVSSLSSCGDAKIRSLTSQLLERFEHIDTVSNRLSTCWGEYLDEFANTEQELSELKANGVDTPDYNGEITEVVDQMILPVLNGNSSLRDLGYLYKTGNDFKNPIAAQYSYAAGLNCTDYCWRKLRDDDGIYLPWSRNANSWDDEWEARGGYVFTVQDDGNGGFTNLDKIHSGDVICLQSIGNGLGKTCGHVIYLEVNDDGSCAIYEGGATIGERVTEFDSLEEAFRSSRIPTYGENCKILSMTQVGE